MFRDGRYVIVLLLAFSISAAGQDKVVTHTAIREKSKSASSSYIITKIPPDDAQHMLNALIPKGKKFVTIQVYTPGDTTKTVDLGTHCSGASSGKVDEDGNIGMSGSTSCREAYENVNNVWLGFRDTSNPDAAFMLTVRCDEVYRWNHCEVPPTGVFYPVVLEREKHGGFKVYIGHNAQEKIGDKAKTTVSTWHVLYLEHIVPKVATATAPAPTPVTPATPAARPTTSVAPAVVPVANTTVHGSTIDGGSQPSLGEHARKLQSKKQKDQQPPE